MRFNLFTRSRPSETPAPPPVEERAFTLEDVFGVPPVSSGAFVGPTSAMGVPSVRRAVEALAEGVSGLPCVVYETTTSGAVQPAVNHVLVDLFGGNVNDWTPATLFFEQLTRDAILWGNAFAWITRDGIGTVRELIRLRPGDVTVAEDVTNPLSAPIYRLGGNVVDRNNLLHIRAPSLDGISGQSPVTACREAIGIVLAIEGHVARLFGNGAKPSGLISFKDRLAPEAAAKAKAAWQAAHGNGRSGATAVLDDGADYRPISLSSVDAQVLELWQHAVDEIARVFGVPPHLLFDLDRATWSNAGEMGASFLRFGLSRWLRAWEGELNSKLIAPEDRRRLTIEFDTDALTRTDLAARADAYSTMISARVMTPNEARAREGLVPHADGDELVNPFTTSAKAPTDQTGGRANG